MMMNTMINDFGEQPSGALVLYERLGKNRCGSGVAWLAGWGSQ
jgi:hypothetical protein